jgi:catechol 2,3-dioxygenase
MSITQGFLISFSQETAQLYVHASKKLLKAAFAFGSLGRPSNMSIIKPVLHHVTVKTNQLQAMVDWYRVLVGADVQFQDANNAWMTNDGANHRIAFLSVPALESDKDKVKHIGMHHTAFEYASFGDLVSSYERLKVAGVVPAFCLEHGLTVSFYYKDPDANYVELQSDNFGDWSKSSAWMRTSPEFAANPIGFFFDPEIVSRRFAAGDTFKDIQIDIRAGLIPPIGAPDIGLPV